MPGLARSARSSLSCAYLVNLRLPRAGRYCHGRQALALIGDLRPIEEAPMNCQPPQTPGNSAPAVEDPALHIAPAIPQPDVAELLAASLQHHQAGRLVEAEAHYRRILKIAPDHADVLHLLGGVAYQTGRHEAAIELIGRAIERNGNDPSYHCSRGLVLQALAAIIHQVA
jgi:tetratricopeptide (TPR) repeat protein